MRERRRLGEELEGQAVAGIVRIEQIAGEGQKLAAVLGLPVFVQRIEFAEPFAGLRIA
jgi:hypothetical protein